MNAAAHANLIGADLEGRVIASLLAHDRPVVDRAMARLDEECFVSANAQALFKACAAQLREIPAGQKLDPSDVVDAAGGTDWGRIGKLREFAVQHIGPINGTSIMRLVRHDQIDVKVSQLIELRAKRVASQQAKGILTDLSEGKIDVQAASDELGDAAAEIDKQLGEPRICTRCKLELHGPGTAQPYDRGVLEEDDGDVLLLCSPCAWRRERAACRTGAAA